MLVLMQYWCWSVCSDVVAVAVSLSLLLVAVVAVVAVVTAAVCDVLAGAVSV